MASTPTALPTKLRSLITGEIWMVPQDATVEMIQALLDRGIMERMPEESVKAKAKKEDTPS